MHYILDWLMPFFLPWMGFCFIDDCIESTTKSHQRAVMKKSNVIQPDVLGTRKGTAFTTKPLTNNDEMHQENNRTLIRKLAEKSNVAAENKILKAELAKLEFQLALSNNKIRQLENEKDEWASASSQSAMDSRILTLEQENLRLMEKELKSSRVNIEAKDRLLEVISFLSSDNTATDSIDNVLENNLTGFEDKNTEVLRLLAESKMEISKPAEIQQASSDFGNPTPPINVSYQPNDEILFDELHHSTFDSMDDLFASPPAASSSFIDTNEEDDDIEYQFLVFNNSPSRSVHGEDIIRQFELMVGAVKNYTMFADPNGNYSGIMGVNFVDPPDARRAHKIFDGMFFEGHNQKVEVRFSVNGKQSYQKEEDSVPATLTSFEADWIKAINASPPIDYATTVSESYQKEEDSVPVTDFEADWIKAINASPPIDYATTVSEDLSTMSSQQNSCFPIAEPLPGKKRTFEDVVGRAIPPSVRKLLPSATSSNRSAAEQPTNASEIKSVTNGRSLSVSPTYGRPVSSSRLGYSASKIPVRVSNGPFATETVKPNETKNIGFKSKIPIRVKTMNRTFPQTENSISTDVSSESRPSVKTVLPSANVVASKIPVRIATSKQIVSDNKPNVTSELQQSLADNKLKPKIPVRSTRSSAERQTFNKVAQLKKSEGSSCGLACNSRISPPSIGSSRGRNAAK